MHWVHFLYTFKDSFLSYENYAKQYRAPVNFINDKQIRSLH